MAVKKYNEKQVEKEEGTKHEMSAETGFMENNLTFYYSYNEFEEYKNLEEILPVKKEKKGLKMAECDRVHGKIRKIVHIAK